MQRRSKTPWRMTTSTSNRTPWKDRIYHHRLQLHHRRVPFRKLALDVTTVSVLRNSVVNLLETSPYPVTVQIMANALVGDPIIIDVYSELTESAAPAASTTPTSGQFSILKNRFVNYCHGKAKLDPVVQRKYDFMHQLQHLQDSREKSRTIHSWKEAVAALCTVFDFVSPAATEETGDSNNVKNEQGSDDSILQDFQKRLRDFHLSQVQETNSARQEIVGLRSSHHAWQENVAQSSTFQQQQKQDLEEAKDQEEQEELKLQLLRISKLERFQQQIQKEVAATRQAEAQALAAQCLRPLSEPDLQRLAEAMDETNDPDDVLAQYEQDTCSRQSLETLQPGAWLNDEVIHYFLCMLTVRDESLCRTSGRRRSHFFKSFFMTKLCNDYDAYNPGVYSYKNVKRWSKKVPGEWVYLSCCCVAVL